MRTKFILSVGLLFLGILAINSALGAPVDMPTRPNDIPPNDPAPGEMPPGERLSGSMLPGGTSSASPYTFSGSYTLDGKTGKETNANYTADTDDTSAVYVLNCSKLTLINPTISTRGNSSSMDASSFYGLNAAVLAASDSYVEITGGSVTTTGSGANGVFATGKGTTINLTGITINCTGEGGHGVDATLEGVLNLKDVDIITAGSHGAAIATDRGSGIINVDGGKVATYGRDSPGIYSTGTISVKDAVISGIGAEGAVIEGKNTIALTNTTLNCGKQTTGGIMIYQSFSGDAENGTGNFMMNGGSISSTTGPVFYITNTDAEIDLNAVNVTSASGTLIKAAASDRWGQSGSNGGIVAFTATDEDLAGDLVCDSLSMIEAVLRNGTTLAGSIDSEGKGKFVSLSIDASSTWEVTGTSYLDGLYDGDAGLTNIHGNGFTVYYDSSQKANDWLGAKTYSLADGGELKPIN